MTEFFTELIRFAKPYLENQPPSLDWFTVKENLQETIVFTIKYGGFL